MDPVTAIGLLASISTLISASGEVVQLLRNFKDGEKELAGLVRQIALFEENLKGFYRIFSSPQVIHRISTETLTQVVDESFEELDDLKRQLLQIQKSENSAIRRMKWIQSKANFERINDQIKGKCSMLHSLVSMIQMYAFWL